MAKSKTSTNSSSVSAQVPVSVPVVVKSVDQSEPVVLKTKKVKATPKASEPAVADVAPVTVDTPASVSPSDPIVVDVGVDSEPSLSLLCSMYMEQINKSSLHLASLKSGFRALEKRVNREVKALQKQNSRRKKKSGNRAASGFTKATKISDELAEFLGKDVGTEMARTTVTSEINMYIRSNNLQDKDNGRKINPDTKLQALLKLATTDELTYFNLQKYMSPHFQKAADAAAALLSSA